MRRTKKEYVSTIEAFKALKIGKSVRPKRICDGSYYTYTFGKLNLIPSNGIVDNSTCKTLYAEYIIDDLWEILD